MIHVTTVKGLPRRGTVHTKKELNAILSGFMRLETKFGKVEGWRSSYKSAKSAQTSLCGCIMRRGLPISVVTIDGELYFVRKDM